MNTDTERVYREIENMGSEQQWRQLSFDKTNELSKAICALEEPQVMLFGQSLSEHSFSMLTRKLWTEQDVPEEEDGYNKTLDMVTALKRCLLARLKHPHVSAETKNGLLQQLGRVSIILSPALIQHQLDSRREIEGK